MEFQSLAKQALPLHNPVLNTGVVAELVPKGLPWSSANLLYGSSKFPLTYVSSPQGERMEVRGLIYLLYFFPPILLVEGFQINIAVHAVIARSENGCEAKPKQTRRFLVSLGTSSAIPLWITI